MRKSRFMGWILANVINTEVIQEVIFGIDSFL